MSQGLVRGKLVIGLPVYNGEKMLAEVLASLLKQSYQNFKILISDNCSTDSTPSICKLFEKKDSRIVYVRQEKNIGGEGNFAYVLNASNSEYFSWAADDDIRSVDYVESNISFLDKNPDYIASTSPIRFDSGDFDEFHMGDAPLLGEPYERVLDILRDWRVNGRFYSIYRAEALKKCFVSERYLGSDFATTLALAKVGKYNRASSGSLVLGSKGISSQNNVFRSYRTKLIHWFLPFWELSKFTNKLTSDFPEPVRKEVFSLLVKWNKKAFHAQKEIYMGRGKANYRSLKRKFKETKRGIKKEIIQSVKSRM